MGADQGRKQNGRACHPSKTRRAKAQHLQSVSYRLRRIATRRKLGNGLAAGFARSRGRDGGFAKRLPVWLTDVKRLWLTPG
jgi:hypothetical protein